MTPLADYLDAAARRPWAWGAMDCCFFAGEWIRAATGRDPMEPYRDRYRTAGEAGRLILRAGGLRPLVEREMVRCGFARVASGQTGDIAVLDLAAGSGPARASVMIADGPWWVGRTTDGLAGMRAAPPVMWRVLGDER